MLSVSVTTLRAALAPVVASGDHLPLGATVGFLLSAQRGFHRLAPCHVKGCLVVIRLFVGFELV